MVHGRKVLRCFKTARLRNSAIGVLIGVGYVSLAFGQGGQTEVSKTPPAAPPPVAAAPATPAQPPAAKPASPANPGAAWQTNVAQPPEPAPAATREMDLQVVAKVNEYFNKLTDLQGTFIQTDPDNKQKRGRFYFERPGKVRFDYSAPSTLKIVSDGKYLAIEDRDMNQNERYPLDVTPFRLLLSETVDLAADAKIIGVEHGPDVVILTVEDKKGDVSGRIRLFFNKADMSLKEWIITDAQGLDTRIEVANLEQNKQVAANFFRLSIPGFDRDR
jgi:outer membrane lipoprotein-sorting protein